MALADLLRLSQPKDIRDGMMSYQTPPIPSVQGISGEDILVNARQTPQLSRNETDSQPLNLGNAGMLLEAQEAAKNNPQHKGMFGVKGTLRDVLGLVGDSLLMGGGGKAIYQPTRQREKESDAMQGFTQDPQAAIERTIAAGGDPTPLIKAYQLQQIQQQEVKAAITKQKTAEIERKIKGGNVLSQFLGGVQSGEAWKKLRPVAEKMALAYGLDPEDVPVDYDPDEFRARLLSGIPGGQQLSDEDRDADRAQRAAQFKEAEAGRNRRDNPPTPPRAPQRGRTQVEAEIVDAVTSGKATPGQQKYYDEVIKRPAAKGRSSRSKPAGTASGWGKATVIK